jgi:phosphate:Na+ symporter
MNIVLFVCGIALFLLGIDQLEQGLGRLGDRTLKRILGRYTRTPIQGIGFGMGATVMVQSSSIVSLITLAFVSAGILQLYNAIGIILGANLGTTFTGWIVATIGFKLDLKEVYLPLLGLGATGLLWATNNSRPQAIGRFIYGLGLLIMGMILMKDSIQFLTELIDLNVLRNTPVWVFFLVGALLTAVIQASSAAMMMALTALHGGIIDLESAAAFAIGADLGTTSTVIIGSLKGARIKRRVSAIHFIFNVVTDIIAVLCLPWLLFLITDILRITDPLFALVAFHSAFNILGILIFLPWVRGFQRLIERLIPIDHESHRTVDNVDPSLGDVALHALEQDVASAIQHTLYTNLSRLPSHLLDATDPSLCRVLSDWETEDEYHRLQDNENQLSDYALDLQRAMGESNSSRIKQLLVCLRDSSYAAKAFKDMQEDLNQLYDNQPPKILNALIGDSISFYRGIMVLLTTNSQSATEQLRDLSLALKRSHSEFDLQIYSMIDQRQLNREDASHALNMNRQILIAGHSLINACKHYCLTEPVARTLSEILNLEQ